MDYNQLTQQTMSVLKEGGLDAAITYIDNYITENPTVLEAYLVRSELYTEIGSFQEALDDAEKAIKINPKEAAAYNNRGCIHVKSGNDLNKALSDFNKAIELNSNFAAAYTSRANVYLKMREPQKAINDCTKAIDISPDENIEPYYNRGLAYVNIGETEKAFADYDKVIALDSKNAEAYAKRGLINSQLGRKQEAISDFETFLRLDPDNKNAKLVRDELEQLKSGKTPPSDENSFVTAAKRNKKILFIGSAIGFVLGALFGAGSGNAFGGMWFGIGSGVALSYITDMPGVFMATLNKEGFIEAVKTAVVGGILWFFIFMITGPIGFLIRILRINKDIKLFQ
jgi:tetratricopeptide (TPR) repeat protein